jgi:hypothetical protein
MTSEVCANVNANCANGKEDSEVMTIHITNVTDS